MYKVVASRTRDRMEVVQMSSYEAISLMIAFGMLSENKKPLLSLAGRVTFKVI